MKHRYFGIGLGLLVLAAVAGFIDPHTWTFRASAVEPRYITAPVERGDLRSTLSATGTLAAVVTVKISSQLSGQIAEVLVDFNEKVTRGQPIVRLDPRSFEARVRQAEAALEAARARVTLSRAALDRTNAGLAVARSGVRSAAAQLRSAEARAEAVRRDFDRKNTLVAQQELPPSRGEDAESSHEMATAQVVSAKAEVESRTAAVQAAEADQQMADAQLQFAIGNVKLQEAVLDQARLDLANTIILSPIDGEIIGKDADRGQIVAATLQAPTLFIIAKDLDQMEVLAKVDEADIGRVRVGQSAVFTVDAVPGRTFPGRVTQIRKAPSVIQNVITYTVVLAAPNPELMLLPGMTAVTQIAVYEASDVIKIPNAALRFTPSAGASTARGAQAAPVAAPGQATVWIPGDDGNPSPVPVRLGRSNASATEVLAGHLAPGQHVLVGTRAAPAGGSFLNLW